MINNYVNSIPRFLFCLTLFTIIGCGKRRCSIDKQSPPIFNQELASQPFESTKVKPRVLVFTSGGGGGHISASRAISSILSTDYQVAQVYLLRDIFAPIDPVRHLTFSWAGSEDFYNYLISHRYIRLTNIVCLYGKYAMPRNVDSMQSLLRDFFDSNQPDAIISVVPGVNHALINVCKERSLPLIIIPTDLDHTMFISGLEYADLQYPYYRYFLSFNDELVWKTLKSAKIPSERIVYGGFPINLDFLKKYDISELKKKWSIPENKSVITVLMGAAGSIATYNFAKALAKSKHAIHVIVCLGRNERLRERISRISLLPHVTMTVLGFTNNMAEIMAMSDLLITKCGTVSVCEGIHAKVPLLLDSTASVISWEQVNLNFITKKHFGRALFTLKNLDEELDIFLHRGFSKSCRAHLNHFKKPNFEAELKNCLHELLKDVNLSK